MKIINAFNKNESIRKVLCSVLSLLIPPSKVCEEKDITKIFITDILNVNKRSLLVKHCFQKSDDLESKRNENNNHTTLLMIEDAVASIILHERSDRLSVHDRSIAEFIGTP
jgi:hypothetical protein